MARILVIDDYPPILTVLRVLLSVDGHEVSTATDGPDGLRLAVGSRPFDLALIDVDLPGMDGISVCRSLKNNPVTWHMYVLMMTGRPGQEVERRSRLAGALMVMTKPFLGRLLLAEIARLATPPAGVPNGAKGIHQQKGGRDSRL